MQAAWPWQTGVLDPQGPIGAAERIILLDSTTIMLAVIVPVIVLTLAFAWWFRAGNEKAIHLPDWEFSGRIEVVVWSIPALTVGFLGGIAWVGAHDLDPHVPIKSDVPAVNVQVVALDWKWLFIYPDQHVASVNRLVVPAGAPLSFRLTSATVMNSFFVPQLGSQIYAMSGMTTELHLLADRARNLSRPLRAIQRRRVLRHAFRHGRARQAGFRGLGQDHAFRRGQAGRRELSRNWRSPAAPSRRRHTATSRLGLFETLAMADPPGPATADAGLKICVAPRARN